MLPSPPVPLQVFAFPFHFSAVPHWCCQIYGPRPAGRSLPFPPSHPSRVTIRASVRGRCLTEAAISRGKTTNTLFAVGEPEFPRSILIFPTRAGFPPRPHRKRTICHLIRRS